METPAERAHVSRGDRLLMAVHLVVGIGIAVTVNLVLPDDHGALDALYLVGLGASVPAIVVGIARYRPPARSTVGWVATGLGVATYIGADALWIWYARNGLDPFPSFADTLFFAGMLSMALGAAIFALRRDEADRVAVIDAAIGAGAVGAVVWVTTVVPYVDDPELTMLERVVTGAYPMIDVIVVAAMLRLFLSRGRIPPALGVLLVGLLALTSADVTYHLQELSGSYVEWGWLDLLYMVALTVIGAAALHPSAARLEEIETRPEPSGTGRFLVITGSAMTPLLLLAGGDAMGLDVSGPVVPVIGAGIVTLVVARTWTLMSTSRRLAELRGHQRFTSIIRNSSDAILIVDDVQRIRYASPALVRIWGYESHQLRGTDLDVLVAPDHRAALDAWFQDIGGGAVLDSVWCRRDGEARNVSVIASDLRSDQDIEGIVLTARDVTHRVALEDRLRHEAAHDALTRIANRRRFEDALAGLAAGDAGTTFILFVDVDDFKTVNDTHGHAAGDRLLHATAERLTAMVRPEDLVARLGGDEFGVLLRDTDTDGAELAVARIGDGLGEPFSILGPPLAVGFSLGWTAADVADRETALRRADLAMYEAKHQGKGRAVRFTPELLDAAEQSLDLRRRLARAVIDDELAVHYQPIVEVETGRHIGHEALMRWSPTDGEMVPPDRFVPLAEETGDITAMGAWILERACLDASGWTTDDGGPPPVVSVNVSPVQLDGDGFAELVARTLARSGLPGERLQLELTENVLADEATARRFQSLRSLGVRLAIDDFGTGYGSLEYLRRFDVDVIKIDRSFVTGATANPTLLEGIASLVHGLGVIALAEGVETDEDRVLLSRLGVDQAQGWLWGRPVPYDPDTPAPSSRSVDA